MTLQRNIGPVSVPVSAWHSRQFNDEDPKYMALNYLGVVPKIVWEVCFKNFSRHVLLGKGEGDGACHGHFRWGPGSVLLLLLGLWIVKVVTMYGILSHKLDATVSNSQSDHRWQKMTRTESTRGEREMK